MHTCMESGRVRHYPFVWFQPAVGARRGRGRALRRVATPPRHQRIPIYPRVGGVCCAPRESWCWVLAVHDQGGGVIPTVRGLSGMRWSARNSCLLDRISTPRFDYSIPQPNSLLNNTEHARVVRVTRILVPCSCRWQRDRRRRRSSVGRGWTMEVPRTARARA